MTNSEDVIEVTRNVFTWQAYDPNAKAELFSTALKTTTGNYLIDPIPIPSPGNPPILEKTVGLCVTNSNHTRSVAQFAHITSAPIYVHHEIVGNPDFPNAVGVTDGLQFAPDLVGITIDGGPLGEMALHYDEDGGTLIVGDALINFDPYGFAFLPPKYCKNQKLMRRSLSKLFDYSFKRILFAHGTPILSGARARLEQLLARG